MVTKQTEVGSVKFVTILIRQVRVRRGPNARFVVFRAQKHFLLRQPRLEPPPRRHPQHTYSLRPQLPLLVRRRKLDVLRALS
jgi:hypothetical protein